MRIPIRAQLLVMSLFLTAIPIIGYQYVWELESYLRAGQEQTMIGTARAVASALHERQTLFDSPATQRETVRPGTDLYAVPIRAPIVLDGKFNDWQDAEPLVRHYDERYRIDDTDDPFAQPVSLRFDHAVGRYQQFVYAMFAVKDNVWIPRGANARGIENNDHLLIAMSDSEGNIQRFAIAPRAGGWVNGFRLEPQPNSYEVLGNETQIQGQWVATEDGYNIEIRFPFAMTGGDLAFALVDVDESIRATPVSIIGTANPNQQNELGTIASQSTAIEELLRSLQYARSRVWVVDKHLRVLARAGDIQQAEGLRATRRSSGAPQWWQYIEREYLLPLYYTVLTRPSNDFIDELANAFALQGTDIANALDGNADALWRLSPDNKAVILSAAHPIYVDQKVIGAVIVEQTTNGIRTLRNQALEQLFHGMLAIMIVAVLVILLFATRISNRIRRLRDDTEAVIDASGKIVGELKPMRRYDEIGDLSASFSRVLERLTHYTQYLENMASRLSHELRTPVAIVRSSLDNLAVIQTDESEKAYTERALTGIERLSKILTRMSEATRLEASLASVQKLAFNLKDVVSVCCESYTAIYPSHSIELKISAEKATVTGAPDLLAQLLDKVVANAVEFSHSNTAIGLHLWTEQQTAFVSITNQGQLLPAGMEKDVFQSMVSVREQATQQEDVHLGLGLYIARTIAEFHGGTITIDNLPDHTGVCVILSLPLSN
ncbi:proteobacterial dedicated sortase system histidine kinase [Alteromonas sp. ASW11-36]|uniref:histidine kinase n=1 Tax=Alteromonas arenosi TaxID=3055817 RepID=A0ABT7T0C6_9ALTE|nr:proteobacterial dedicated sortase system histidine kinase [Alteromonas sp. ASW11-36]MDM7861272.1 proteobacterial dedicated sortase system histidine kinase [Alteromonas sp. ASW11-36]